MFVKRPLLASSPAVTVAVRPPEKRWLQPGTVRQPDKVTDQRSWPATWVVGFILIHLPLALVMKRWSLVAGVHAVAIFAVGLWLCVMKNRPQQVAQWAAYVVGAEVLWRMCKAPIPWEFAKHSIWLVCLISMARFKGIRDSWLPVLYFGLLIPAGFITFIELPFGEARSQASFNLAGPLCLAVCALWFPFVRLTPGAFQRISTMLLAPICGFAFIGLLRLATIETQFSDNSNFAASGGYGPNQVSSMLALGALFAILSFFNETHSKLLKACYVMLAILLLGQSVMTFSRTGLYLFCGSFLGAAAFLAQQKRKTLSFVLLMFVLGGAAFAILPMLDSFTGGKLKERFEDKGLTGRDSIARLDLQIWKEHPLFGVGVGMSLYSRSALGDEGPASHTEYTRLVADHGMLGLIALGLLLTMTAQAFLRARGPWAKAVVAGCAVWSWLFMAVTGMRLAAPSFLLGLVHARFVADAQPSDMDQRQARRGCILPKRVLGKSIFARNHPAR
jgi:hypothetical protein